MTKTYAQLTREIQALQASAEKLRATEIKTVIAKINESIAQYGLTADDLRFPGAASRSGAHKAAASSRAASTSDAKYGDGQGNVWGGRGPRPAWLRHALADGRSLESFEMTATTSATQASTSPDTKGRTSKATGSAPKVKLPALYGHPKTGQLWSGRGPKPAWLKQALKKRGVSLDDFLLAPANAPAQAPSPAPAATKPAATARSASATKSAPVKAGTRPKASSGAKPKAAAKPTAAPTQKAPAAKPAAAPAASKAKAVSARPSTSKAPARNAGKPTAKTRTAPRKNLPASMAPSADAAPTPSTVPAAAPLPATPSTSIEGQGGTAAT